LATYKPEDLLGDDLLGPEQQSYRKEKKHAVMILEIIDNRYHHAIHSSRVHVLYVKKEVKLTLYFLGG
jgi:hypothetical protein